MKELAGNANLRRLDISPLRSLTPEIRTQEAAFVAARPTQQRIEGNGGWANGDAVFVGENPPDTAVITYFQRSRHLFGKMKKAHTTCTQPFGEKGQE